MEQTNGRLEPTYRVIASNTHKEVVWRKGLTLEQAQSVRESLAWDPRTWFLLTRIEEEEPVVEPTPCPQAGDPSHIGWYCPACVHAEPTPIPVDADDPRR
jgi:hypothetical protein